MLVDSHCHLNYEGLAERQGEVLAAARGTRSGNAGPVHFDIPLREPLVPDAHSQELAPDGRPAGAPWTQTQNATLDVEVSVQQWTAAPVAADKLDDYRHRSGRAHV